MKITSEYRILSECIERGAAVGYRRAVKHNATPSAETIMDCIVNAVLEDILDYFSFDNDIFENNS
jgi:predicted Zn-dependent protease with MMP-like domain